MYKLFLQSKGGNQIKLFLYKLLFMQRMPPNYFRRKKCYGVHFSSLFLLRLLSIAQMQHNSILKKIKRRPQMV